MKKCNIGGIIFFTFIMKSESDCDSVSARVTSINMTVTILRQHISYEYTKTQLMQLWEQNKQHRSL